MSYVTPTVTTNIIYRIHTKGNEKGINVLLQKKKSNTKEGNKGGNEKQKVCHI